MKKLISVLVVILMAVALQIPVVAETWTSEEFSFQAPQDMYQLSRNTPMDDPAWALAGIADVSEKMKEYNEMDVVVNFVSKDGGFNINVMRKESDIAKKVFNVQNLSEEEKAAFMDQLPKANEDGEMKTQVEKEWLSLGDNLFYQVQIDAVLNDTDVHEHLIGTIVNGYALTCDMFMTGGEGFTSQQVETLKSLAASLEFAEILEKSEPDTTSTLSTLLLLLLLIGALVLPLVYIPVKSRKEKRRKAKLAEELSEYHKTHSADTVEGEAAFINSTDCTKEAIHHFSYFQAYRKNIGELVFGGVMCVAMLAAAFLVETEWWMRLVAVGVAGYYVYKIAVTPSNLEKIQRKVYGRGPSQTAHYSFYPNAFRVSGIQSASVIPYFQITDVRRSGQYLYLYYGPENAYMVDQYGFVLGEFEDFLKFIEEKTRREK